MTGNDKYVGFLAGFTERGLEIAGRSRVISMNYIWACIQYIVVKTVKIPLLIKQNGGFEA